MHIVAPPHPIKTKPDLKEIEIEQLFLYPIKGCGGIKLPAVKLTTLGVASVSGIVRDRTFMVVKAEGKTAFITQRQQPKLSLVRTRIEPEEALLSNSTIPAEDITLVVSAPGMPEDLRIPVVISDPTSKPSIDVTVWGWNGAALEEGSEASAWFSQYLGVPSKLVRYAGSAGAKPVTTSSFERQVDPSWTAEAHPVAFADGFPYLVANEASLKDLNTRLKAENGQQETILMNRFRPNIIVGGASATAWEEDHWEEVKFTTTKSLDNDSGGAVLRNVKPCSRCKVPTINQETAVVGDQPAKLMHTFRSGAVLGWTQPSSFKASVFFGSNMCCISGSGTVIKVGESTMEVLSMLKEPLKGLADYAAM
jgi:uncharacterized protein YcbX